MTATPAHDVTDRTAATDEEFAARIAAFDGAPYPQEVRRAAAQQHIAQQHAKAEAVFGRDVFGTAVDLDALDAARAAAAWQAGPVSLLAAALPEHQSWCHGEAHAECCGAGDCDCGVADSLARLLPLVDRIAAERAAAELEAAAEEGWGPEDQDYVYTEVSDWLRDRAAALRAATGEATR